MADEIFVQKITFNELKGRTIVLVDGNNFHHALQEALHLFKDPQATGMNFGFYFVFFISKEANMHILKDAEKFPWFAHVRAETTSKDASAYDLTMVATRANEFADISSEILILARAGFANEVVESLKVIESKRNISLINNEKFTHFIEEQHNLTYKNGLPAAQLTMESTSTASSAEISLPHADFNERFNHFISVIICKFVLPFDLANLAVKCSTLGSALRSQQVYSEKRGLDTLLAHAIELGYGVRRGEQGNAEFLFYQDKIKEEMRKKFEKFKTIIRENVLEQGKVFVELSDLDSILKNRKMYLSEENIIIVAFLACKLEYAILENQRLHFIKEKF